ncbi:ribosomal protein S4 [Klebsiella pneumoniae]|nr:ribosomal protein S4 [Klebsiella pneumoniae]
MLYVVECAYTDPQSEAAWNTFYNQEKLPALVSVPGFYASQRFRALSEGCPCYLALHDIHDATVIDSDAYRRNGGGHFARWQSAIADWHRTSILRIIRCGRLPRMKCCCWAIPRRTCPSLRDTPAARRPGDRTKPVCRHRPTRQPASPGHDCRRLYLSAHHRPVTQPGAARVRSPCHLLPFIR